MSILLKSLRFIDCDTVHELNDYVVDSDGLREYDADSSVNITETIDCQGLFCSEGWVDLRCLAGEPGEEYKETLESLGELLKQSGFAKAVLMPNTKPALQFKSDLLSLKQRTSEWFTEALFQVSVTKDNKGEDFTDILDLNAHGGYIFGDGLQPLSNPDRFMKVLQYLQKFDGVLFDHSYEPLLALFGQMHEGVVSTRIGMKGIPNLAEEVAVKRNIDILRYAGGNLHFQTISTAGAVTEIRKAKQEGLNVTCDVSVYQLIFTDDDLQSFDTHLKVNPPFRSKEDREALIAGLKDGTIDALVSNHQPQDFDAKHMEFDLASSGMIGLQTFLPALVKLSEEMSWPLLISKVTKSADAVLRSHGSKSTKFTIFDPKASWEYDVNSNFSLSSNHPWMNTALAGKVKYVISQGELIKL
ncbi:dihydroorotase [Belliella kenyensis]|uniref:Dihydroorotase n=1 Tax=Belliella kenyensis TaxID=1472724 RepID=A0ABV8EJL5_9BACT|nr:dihydroorotase [Belliella kenyensis]MCH7402450.1 dihydroorotase [Belliella kenyensis]MDN3603641.1 dihydroorotase [Belliella kenyensis]